MSFETGTSTKHLAARGIQEADFRLEIVSHRLQICDITDDGGSAIRHFLVA